MSSDSDSGNGDGDKKVGRHVSHGSTDTRVGAASNRKQSPRKQARQNPKTQRQTKPWSRSSKAGKNRKAIRCRSSRELTESDSGQEMHFSFDHDHFWGESAQRSEDWDDRMAHVGNKRKDALLVSSSGSSSCTIPGASPRLPSSGASPTSPRLGSPDPAGDKNSCIRTIHGAMSTSLPLPSVDFACAVDEGVEEMPEPDVSLPLLIPVIPAFMTTATAGDNEEDDFSICEDLFAPGGSQPSDLGSVLSRGLNEPNASQVSCPKEGSSDEQPNLSDVLDSAMRSVSSLVIDDDLPVSHARSFTVDVPSGNGGGGGASDTCEKGTTLLSYSGTQVVHNDVCDLSNDQDIVGLDDPVMFDCQSLYCDSHVERASVTQFNDRTDCRVLSEPPNSSANVGHKHSEKSTRKPKKGKKAKQNSSHGRSTIDIQGIESEAYALFELAKSVVPQSRNCGSFSPHGEGSSADADCHRRLQIAAFQIGLFALSVHNRSSPNWFSRTYSSYVSWIDHQAVDIGTAALLLLQEEWEDVLTPSEVVNIACRMAGQGDMLLQRTAAELALSCLPHANTLNSAEITQTLSLCRKQDSEMLERACTAVESAGRNGGVHPEILFRIAREWYNLHEEAFKRDSPVRSLESPDRCTNMACRGIKPAVMNLPHQAPALSQQSGPPFSQYFLPVYLTPEQYVQEQMHQQAQEMLSRQLGRPCDFESGFTWIYPQYMGPLHHYPLPQQVIHGRRIPGSLDSFSVALPNYPDDLNMTDVPRYLQNAFRVGMHALEALSMRMDDRPEIKYALSPPCTDHVKWLCALAASLGPPYLKNFCKVAYNAVTSPFVLHDIALEAARHFALYNPAQLASHLRSPSVSPIVQKALTMYTELVHHDLVLLSQHGYHDFVELLRRARSAFCMAPGGMNRFNEILEVVRKTYPKKRELWQMLMNGLSKA